MSLRSQLSRSTEVQREWETSNKGFVKQLQAEKEKNQRLEREREDAKKEHMYEKEKAAKEKVVLIICMYILIEVIGVAPNST